MSVKDLFGVALLLQHCIACVHGSGNVITLLQALRDDAELRRKQEIHEAEESKNAHIQDLMKKHEKVLLLRMCTTTTSSAGHLLHGLMPAA